MIREGLSLFFSVDKQLQVMVKQVLGEKIVEFQKESIALM